MKIVHIISGLGNGGAEKFVVELSNAQSLEHDVSIITFRNIDGSMFHPRKIKKSVQLYQLGKKDGFDIKLLLKLSKLISNISPDIVNTHLDSTLRYTYIISLLFRKPIYFQTIHYELDNKKLKLFNFFKRLPYFKTKFHNVCISRSIWKDFSKGFKELSFYHIDNGISKLEKSSKYQDVQEELNEYKKEGNKVFIAVGRFNYYKNFQMLVSLFCRLNHEGKKVKLILIGGDPVKEADEIKKVNQIKCQNTLLTGQKENVADYLYNANAFILSSRSEGMPIVILEALSIGLPVVSTPAGGVIDLIKDKYNGYISESCEENSLYKSTVEYLNDEEENIDGIMDNNIKDFKLKYSIDVCAKKYIDLYQEKMLNNK